MPNGIEFLIDKIKVDEGPVKDTFTLHFSGVSMVGGVLKDSGMIDGITLIVKGDQSIFIKGLGMLSGLMSVFQPDLSKKEKGAIVTALLNGLPEKGKNKKISGNLKYTSNSNEITGLMLTVGPTS